MTTVLGTLFRLTFNVPAKKLFFDEDTTAIRIRLDEDSVAFISIADGDEFADAVAVKDRTRGDKEGHKVDLMQKLLLQIALSLLMVMK